MFDKVINRAYVDVRYIIYGKYKNVIRTFCTHASLKIYLQNAKNILQQLFACSMMI